MKQSGVEVAMYGFDLRSIEAFEIFFNCHCNREFRIAKDKKMADMAIIEVELVNRSGIIGEIRGQRADVPIIALSSREVECEDSLVFGLTKPLVYSELHKLLRQIVMLTPENISPIRELRDALVRHIQKNRPKPRPSKKKMAMVVSPMDVSLMDKTQLATLVGRQKNIDVENPQQVMSVLFDSKKYFLGAVLKAMKRATYEKRMLKMTNLENTIIIDPSIKRVYSFVSESVLRPLCLMEVREISSIKPIKRNRDRKEVDALFETFKDEVTEWTWDEFLWKTALWTARGKVPKEINLTQPVYLKYWPNLTRFQLTPHALAIATIMREAPATLPAIAERLGIEQRFVFAFFTAAYTLGIADNSVRQKDTLFKPEQLPVTENNQSLFRRILSRLGNQTTETDGESLDKISGGGQ